MMDNKCGLWEEGVLGPGVGASGASCGACLGLVPYVMGEYRISIAL